MTTTTGALLAAAVLTLAGVLIVLTRRATRTIDDAPGWVVCEHHRTTWCDCPDVALREASEALPDWDIHYRGQRRDGGAR